MLVVELFIALQCGLQILTRTETGDGENVADAPVKAFNHAVGLRGTWLGQMMFDAEQGALAVEGVVMSLALSDSPMRVQLFHHTTGHA